jgi:hypothetical protein
MDVEEAADDAEDEANWGWLGLLVSPARSGSVAATTRGRSRRSGASRAARTG